MSPRHSIILVVAAFFTLAVAEVTSPQSSTYFINGGSTETSNYSIHEAIVPFFVDSFLGKNAKILNAGGPRALIVPILPSGNVERSQAGMINFKPSSLSSPAATKSNVMKLFSSLKDNKIKRVTLVYGDHGSIEGVSLWNDNTLNAHELLRLHQNLDDETLIRSIHLHCHSGAALIDPARTLPTDESAWPFYLSGHYRGQSCGLGMSRHDEISNYTGWPDGRAWKTLLNTRPLNSLQAFKDLMATDDNFYGTPVLTSDYLVSDIKHFLCHKRKKDLPTTTEVTDSHDDAKVLKPKRAMADTHPCDNDTAIDKAIHENTEAYDSASEKYLEFHKMMNRIARHLLNFHGKLSETEMKESWKRIEKIKADFILELQGKEPTLAQIEELEKKVQAQRTQSIIDYAKTLESVLWGVHLRKEMDTYFAGTTYKNWMQGEGAKEFPLIAKLLADPAFSQKGFIGIDHELTRIRFTAQKERKKLLLKKQETDRKFVKSGLEHYPEIKKVLDAIESCENSAFAH